MIQNDLEDTWVETRTENGKCYYYNATTRETTWNKPESAKIVTQEQLLQNSLSNLQSNHNNKTDNGVLKKII